MRTIKRKALPLNKNKLMTIHLLCRAYAAEKNHWLDVLKEWKYQSLLSVPRKIRDEFIYKGYQSKNGLQARHWKLALQDAVETWDKNWKAQFIPVRSKIASHFKQENERHYAYWLLTGYSQFSQMMQGKAPKPPFEIDKAACKSIAEYIQRQVKKHRPKQPAVKTARSIKFDADCYTVFEENGTQYIKIMTLDKGKRITIPLTGKGLIEGNITLVIDGKDIFIHTTQELTLKPPSQGAMEAVDFGYSEVMTDTEGKRYGIQFGNILTKTTNKRHTKMQKRHKLHAIRKKQTKKHKRKHLLKYNLGNQKLTKNTKKANITLEKEINTAINELLENKDPSLLITENLSHCFTYHKPKHINRKLSAWMRGKLQERVAFKALAEGFRHEQVNPAYGSQTCLCCDFVDRSNRNKDKFKCLNCGYEDIADRVAATNYFRRFGDETIGLHMPYSQVKTILLERFNRRLEAGKPATVPGKTLETVEGISSQVPFEIRKLLQPVENYFAKPDGPSESETKQTRVQHILTRF
jgi:putative transposase